MFTLSLPYGPGRSGCRAVSGRAGCNTSCPLRREPGHCDAGRMSRDAFTVIVVLDEQQARSDVDAGRMRCTCGRPLRPWGFARPRAVRQADGSTRPLRPARVRCKGCQVSHVLVPAACPPRSAYAIDVVGQALVAKALGAGHRSIAGRLNVPAATVRGWLRRAGAEQLRRRAAGLLADFDPDPPPLEPTGSALGDALTALAATALAAADRGGPTRG
jgi:Domain of unknown function (DUF6431)